MQQFRRIAAVVDHPQPVHETHQGPGVPRHGRAFANQRVAEQGRSRCAQGRDGVENPAFLLHGSGRTVNQAADADGIHLVPDGDGLECVAHVAFRRKTLQALCRVAQAVFIQVDQGDPLPAFVKPGMIEEIARTHTDIRMAGSGVLAVDLDVTPALALPEKAGKDPDHQKIVKVQEQRRISLDPVPVRPNVHTLLPSGKKACRNPWPGSGHHCGLCVLLANYASLAFFLALLSRLSGPATGHSAKANCVSVFTRLSDISL